MSRSIEIRQARLTVIELSEGDFIGLPDDDPEDGASIISEAAWIAHVDDAGSEEAVMEALGVEEDCRQDFEWRYVPEAEPEEEI